MNIKLKLTGMKDLKRALKEAGPRATKSLSAGLFTEGERIMAKSKRLTPVDTGTLRSTGHVQKPVVEEGRIEVTLGFGGPAAPYAIYVHEMIENHHEVGQAKFLEQPVNEAARGFTERLAAEVRRNL